MFSGGPTELKLDYDPDKGEVYFGPLSCEITKRNFHGKLRRGFKEVIGDSVKNILYRAGKKTGMIFATNFDDIDILSKLGYGVPVVDGKKITVKNSYTSMDYTSDEPVCELLEGILAGWFTVKEGKNIGFQEMKCRATSKEECVFEKKRGKFYIEAPELPWEKGKDLDSFKLKWDEEKGEVVYKKSNSLILPRGFTSILQHEFERFIGPVSRTLMYKKVREISYEAVNEELGLKGALSYIPGKSVDRKIIKEVLKQVQERGFGVPEVVESDFSKPWVKISVKNSYNTYNYDESRPVCTTFAGVIAGGSSAVFDQELDCKEEECVAAGDEKCLFTVKPSEK